MLFTQLLRESQSENMSIQVNDKSFIVTLTSNEFQDEFPNNSVSRFRARLPAQYILPHNVQYNVALVKLLYRNTINNLGRGANTQLFVSNGINYEKIKIPLPELQVNTLGEIVAVLKNEFRRVLPNYILKENEPETSPGIAMCAIAHENIAKQIKAISLKTNMQERIISQSVGPNALFRTSIYPGYLEPIEERDEEYMQDLPAEDESANFQISALQQETYDYFDAKQIVVGKLIRYLYDPFYTFEERCVKFFKEYPKLEYFQSSRDVGDYQKKRALWQHNEKSWGPFPFMLLDRIYLKFWSMHIKVFQYARNINLFKTDARKVNVKIKFKMEIEDNRDVILSNLFPTIEAELETDASKENFFKDEIKNHPFVILFEILKLVKAENLEPDPEILEKYEAAAFQGYFELLELLQTIQINGQNIFMSNRQDEFHDDLVLEYHKINRIKAHIEKEFPEEAGKALAKRTLSKAPEDAQIKSEKETKTTKYTQAEWNDLLKKLKETAKTNSWEFLSLQSIYNSQNYKFLKKVRAKKITKDTPDEELSAVERYFKNISFGAIDRIIEIKENLAPPGDDEEEDSSEEISQSGEGSPQENVDPLATDQQPKETGQSQLTSKTFENAPEVKVTDASEDKKDTSEVSQSRKRPFSETHDGLPETTSTNGEGGQEIKPGDKKSDDFGVQSNSSQVNEERTGQPQFPESLPETSSSTASSERPITTPSAKPPPEIDVHEPKKKKQKLTDEIKMSEQKKSNVSENLEKDSSETPEAVESKHPGEENKIPDELKSESQLRSNLARINKPRPNWNLGVNAVPDKKLTFRIKGLSSESLVREEKKVTYTRAKKTERFSTMIAPEYEEISNLSNINPSQPADQDFWNDQATLMHLSMLSDEFRFSQTPKSERKDDDFINFLKLMINFYTPSLHQLVPAFVPAETTEIASHMYYYPDIEDFHINPEILTKIILKIAYDPATQQMMNVLGQEKYYPKASREIYEWLNATYVKQNYQIRLREGEILRDSSLDAYQISQLLSNHGVFSLQTNWFDFDFGVSMELLSLLGLSKNTNFLEENFDRRQLYRYWLNGIARDSRQQWENPEALVHYYVTGRNFHHTDKDLEKKINELTKTKPDSLFKGAIIHKFGELFANQASPDNNLNLVHGKPGVNIFSFIQFLTSDCEIWGLENVWASLIVRTKSKSIREVLESIPQKEYRDFMKIFYRGDPIIEKKLQLGTSQFYPLNPHDIIAFMLWYCNKGMPLGRQIISQVPPKLNPYTEFWIYSDIIKEEVVSRHFGKLLAMCTTPQNLNMGDQAEVTYNFPLFKPLSVQTLNEIEIFIATRFGNPVPFTDGPSTVQLLFEVKK